MVSIIEFRMVGRLFGVVSYLLWATLLFACGGATLGYEQGDAGALSSSGGDSSLGADTQEHDSGSVLETGVQEASPHDTGIFEASLDGTEVSDGPAEGASEGQGNITFVVQPAVLNAGTASGTSLKLNGASSQFTVSLILPADAPATVSYTINTTTFDATGWSASIQSSLVGDATPGNIPFDITVTAPTATAAQTMMHVSVVCSTNTNFFGKQSFTVSP
jgi:hypothetical protein